jgi:hypothetical protein
MARKKVLFLIKNIYTVCKNCPLDEGLSKTLSFKIIYESK